MEFVLSSADADTPLIALFASICDVRPSTMLCQILPHSKSGGDDTERLQVSL